jgi:hypothetical protein
MKKALTAALFGGLLVLAGPQAAFADHAADHGSGHEAGQPEASPQPDGAAHPEDSPEPERAPAGDRESHDKEGDFLLF